MLCNWLRSGGSSDQHTVAKLVRRWMDWHDRGTTSTTRPRTITSLRTQVGHKGTPHASPHPQSRDTAFWGARNRTFLNPTSTSRSQGPTEGHTIGHTAEPKSSSIKQHVMHATRRDCSHFLELLTRSPSSSRHSTYELGRSWGVAAVLLSVVAATLGLPRSNLLVASSYRYLASRRYSYLSRPVRGCLEAPSSPDAEPRHTLTTRPPPTRATSTNVETFMAMPSACEPHSPRED